MPGAGWRLLILFLAVTALTAGMAQAPAGSGPAQVRGGTVRGRVLLGDLQLPARFAMVQLFRLEGASLAAGWRAGEPVNITAWTDSGGEYEVAGLPAGDYLVTASKAGYLGAGMILLRAYRTGAELNEPVAGLPVVHVAEERVSEASFSLERGGSVGGRVSWTDGSPVTDATVAVRPIERGAGKKLPPVVEYFLARRTGTLALVDDRGRFRVAGLLPGQYVVSARVSVADRRTDLHGELAEGSSPLKWSVLVYAPSVFHREDATVRTLHGTEEVSDENITVDLDSLRNVSGSVVSAVDHHAVNAGTVLLENAADGRFSRSAAIGADGSFVFGLVPAGSYQMTVQGEDAVSAVDPQSKEAVQHVVQRYKDVTRPLTVGDVDVALPPMVVAPRRSTAEEEKEDGGRGQGASC